MPSLCGAACRGVSRVVPALAPPSTRRRVTAVVECASKRRGLASAASFASAGLLPPSGRFFSFAGFVHRRCATWLCRESSRLGSRCDPLLREEPRSAHTRGACRTARLRGGSTRPPAQGRRVSSSPSSSLVLVLKELLYFIRLPYRATLALPTGLQEGAGLRAAFSSLHVNTETP